MNDLFFMQLVKKKCQKFYIACNQTLSFFKKNLLEGDFGGRGVPNNPPAFIDMVRVLLGINFPLSSPG